MKKVSLRELVADKIIFAILIAIYYWMWARNDWKDYYTTIQTNFHLLLFYQPWDPSPEIQARGSGRNG